MSKPRKFKVEHEVSEQQVAELLCCAWEGGSHYWAESRETPYKYRANNTMRLRLPVKVCDVEDPSEQWILDESAIERGLRLLGEPKYARHLSDWINDNADATTGDVFLQLCLFGEIVFG